MAAKTNEPVAVIDADTQFGDMTVFFNLTPQSTIVEVVRDISFLSPVTLRTYFTDTGRNLQVLCGTSKPDMAETITIEGFTSLVKMSRNLYKYILIDIPSGFQIFQLQPANSLTRRLLRPWLMAAMKCST